MLIYLLKFNQDENDQLDRNQTVVKVLKRLLNHQYKYKDVDTLFILCKKFVLAKSSNHDATKYVQEI